MENTVTFRHISTSKFCLLILCAHLPVRSVQALPGDVDLGFRPNLTGYVIACSVQRDGKILVARYESPYGWDSHSSLVRLHPDGTVDEAFHVDVPGSVLCVAVDADGKILLGGGFSQVNGQERHHLARLHADGSLDEAFDPDVNNLVYCIAIQSDGKILLGGGFTNVGGHARHRIARLVAEGALDEEFSAAANGDVVTLVPLDNGKILLGGRFTTLNGVARSKLAIVGNDGALDPDFTLAVIGEEVTSLALVAGGHICLAGNFTSVGGLARQGLARMQTNGTVDPDFAPSMTPVGYYQNILTLAPQADGKMILGGRFSKVNGVNRRNLARLNANGSLDTGFAPYTNADANSVVFALGVQPDGKVLVGGIFATLNGASQANFGRLENNPSSQEFSIDGNTRVEWARGGAAPEAQAVFFDWADQPGGPYSALGTGSRTSNGWEIAGLSLPSVGQVRARALIPMGSGNGCVAWASAAEAKGRAAAPSITVFASNQSLQNGATVDMGFASPGDPQSLTLVVRNVGEADLTGLSASLSGPDTNHFHIARQPAPIVSGPAGETLITVVLTHATPGAKTVGFRLVGNQLEPAFDLILSGTTGVSSDANLAALQVDRSDLAPAFDPDVSLYEAQVSLAHSNLVVRPTSSHPAATITVNGTPVISGSASAPIPLSVGTNLITTLVTAQDGSTRKAYTSAVVRADAYFPGDVDPSVHTGANGDVLALAEQPDGKLLLGGAFTGMLDETRNRLARLNPDGSLDTAFNPDANGQVHAVAVQEDGRIVVAGDFTSVGGIARTRLARLQPDGSVDTAFATAANNTINALAIQPDRRIVLGGTFTTVGGLPRNGLARLLVDGSVDPTFQPSINVSFGYRVANVAVQSDGRILVVGHFHTVNGQARNGMVRLMSDGAIEPAFQAAVENVADFAAIQADGKILIGGQYFVGINGWARTGIARLNVDGSVDASFDTEVGGPYQSALSAVIDTAGNSVLGGSFLHVSRLGFLRVARLYPDGSLWPYFSPNPNSDVSGCLSLSDGKILLGGAFTSIGGLPRNRLARLYNSPATQGLIVPSASRAQWLRGGTSPETQLVSFEVSTDAGATYRSVGQGARIPGGWEIAGQPLPAAGRVRARARIAGGRYNGSSGLVETLADYSFLPLSIVEAWRDQYFDSPADAGDGADLADPDQDGLTNLAERAFGLHPAQDSRGRLPHGVVDGATYEIRFTAPAAAAGLVYSAEYSATYPAAGPWLSVPDTGTPPEHVFAVPLQAEPRGYVRLTVTDP